MEHYQDITLLPDAEANLGFLWQKVFQQVHIALAEHKIGENSSAIALSIPGYHNDKSRKAFPLGSQLRLFASQEKLEALNVGQWLSRLTDYVHIKSIKPVPNDVKQYACFKRKHLKGVSSTEKKIERKAKHISTKFGVDYEECLQELVNKHPPADSELPFITIARNKAGEPVANSFPLFITMEVIDAPLRGELTCYGFSSPAEGKSATVPWF